MLRMLITRLRQGRRTLAFPPASPALPERFRGRPILDSRRCDAVTPPCGAERTAGALFARGPLALSDERAVRDADGREIEDCA